ncbi:hypothetical protein [Acinetobacter pittii]|nr:hypothetical protein [Acinetobacter pittii]
MNNAAHQFANKVVAQYQFAYFGESDRSFRFYPITFSWQSKT